MLDRQAANSIRRQIVNGTMPPGHRLLETELAGNLEVSRGTIRSALCSSPPRALSARSRSPNGRSRRPRFTRHGSSTRCAPHWRALAARLAAERATPADRAELEKAFAELEKAAGGGDREAIIDADFNLHRVVVGMSGHAA